MSQAAAAPALFENRDDGPFDGDRLRLLVENAAQLQSLTEHPGWQVLRDEAERTIAAEERIVMRGRCDPQEYARRVGRVQAARGFLNLPDAVIAHARQMQAAQQQEEE